MTISIKQEKEEETVMFEKKKSSTMKIKQEVDQSIRGTSDNNNNIEVKQEEDDGGDLNSQTPTLKDESADKKYNYYESSHTQTSAINYLMDDIEENRPFGCDICKKRYKRAFDLKSHFRSHTGERPCPCMYCSKAFDRSNARDE